MYSLCVYCGSGRGTQPEYQDLAHQVGLEIARRGMRLVYGGSHLGLMGTVADAARLAGAPVTGIMPELLVEKEAAHRELSDLRIVGSMHERKALMAAQSDGFLTLPGGIGTLDELCEMITWRVLGMHTKPIVLWNGNGYYNHLLHFLEVAGREGFFHPRKLHSVKVGQTVDECFQLLNAPSPVL